MKFTRVTTNNRYTRVLSRDTSILSFTAHLTLVEECDDDCNFFLSACDRSLWSSLVKVGRSISGFIINDIRNSVRNYKAERQEKENDPCQNDKNAI